MKKKLVAILAAGTMTAMTLAGCGSSSANSGEAEAVADAAEETLEETASAENAEETAENAGGETFTVGVCQLVQHDALDAATQGFVDALTAYYGDNVTIDVQNAQGDSTTCATIVNGFVSNGYDLILANATPALQAAMAATTDIPILGTAVTDYGTALNVTDFSGTTGINVAGTSDLAPLDQQEDMILELVPDAQNVGILYCSAEPNSKFQGDKVAEYLTEDGVASETYTFADSNDIQAVVSSMVGSVDAVYIPTDNTAAANMTLVQNVLGPAGVPVICGEEGMMSNGGLATLSISYYSIGEQAAEQAIDILTNGADVSTIEIGYATEFTKEYNPAYAELIGITVPDDYVAFEAE